MHAQSCAFLDTNCSASARFQKKKTSTRTETKNSTIRDKIKIRPHHFDAGNTVCMSAKETSVQLTLANLTGFALEKTSPMKEGVNV